MLDHANSDRTPNCRNKHCAPVRYGQAGASVLARPNSPLVEQWVRAYWGTATSLEDSLARVRAWSRELALHG